MRKLLYSLLPLSAIGITTLPIISCSKESEDDKFSQFLKHVDNNETFIYYIGAKNCSTCTKANTTFWNKIFKDGNLTEEGKKEKAKLDTKYIDAKQINLKGYHVEIDDYDDWVNKVGEWAKKLKKWVADEILKFSDLLISGEKDKTLSEANIKFEGTPMFIFIKNGKFAGYTTVTEQVNNFMNKIEDHLYIGDWFNKNEYIIATKEPNPDDPNKENQINPK